MNKTESPQSLQLVNSSECVKFLNFRKIPPPRYPEDELAAEPWYSVGINDVFPEEFRTFLLINPKVRTLFDELHSDLFEASYWQKLQQNIVEENYPDVIPYPSENFM